MNAPVFLFVDGSYIDGKVGYGAVVIQRNTILKEFSGSVPNEEATQQIAGELMAVGYGLRWCEQQGFTEITVCYDYNGVECWATGKWKAKSEIAIRYVDFIKKCPLKIKWKKIAAHTGNHWNEYADQLAKIGSS